MKKIRIAGLLLVLLMMIFFTPKTFAQTQKFETPDFELTISNDNGDSYIFTGGLEEIKITPSGVFKRTLTFQLDPDEHPFMIYVNSYAFIRISLEIDLDSDGEYDVMVRDKRTVLTPTGQFKINVIYKDK